MTGLTCSSERGDFPIAEPPRQAGDLPDRARALFAPHAEPARSMVEHLGAAEE
ncbi:MAG TPA: hypothetical protein VKA84_18330 [Gemmatimonadaceae bacterium]|nr:hypothetical protein [Gemmatimonadaceae bacterium]